MPKTVPLTQRNLINYVGFYPGINEIVNLTDYGGDSDICVELHRLREFHIEWQNMAEFWVNLRHEFWPELMD